MCHTSFILLIIVYQSSLMKLLENSPKIAEIQSRLTKYTYLSRTNLPGYSDGVIFQALKKVQKYPDRSKNPNFYHWYILLRQFATSTISKWVQDRLYYDSNDALIQNFIKQQPVQAAETLHSYPSNPSSRQQNSNDVKSPKSEMGGDVQYEIDILLNEYSNEMIENLKRDLEIYRLEIVVSKESKQVKIYCGSQSNKREEIVNLISRTIEYKNLQVKKDKTFKQPVREEAQRE